MNPIKHDILSKSTIDELPLDLPEDPETTFGVDFEKSEFLAGMFEDLLASEASLQLDLKPNNLSSKFGSSQDSNFNRNVALRDLARQTAFWAEAAKAEGYRLLGQFGSGGCGEIWEAEQKSLRRIIAIKRIRLDRMRERLARAKDDNERQLIRDRYSFQIRHEALLTASLEHPNIMPVHDMAIDDHGGLMIVMKRVFGIPWSQMIRQDFDTMNREEYLAKHIAIMIQTSQAIAFAHSRGIIHRDIKPSQVMVGDFGEVLLMDFGLSASVDGSALSERWKPEIQRLPPTIQYMSIRAGTPYYMAPEQTRDDFSAIGPWTDVYLLGATLYTVLTGRWPRNSNNSKEVFRMASEGIYTPIEEANPEVSIPQELADLVAMSMIADHESRTLTASGFLQQLVAFERGYGKRQKSMALCDEARLLVNQSSMNYSIISDTLTILDNARTAWGQNPELEELQKNVFIAYTRLAIRCGDLELASGTVSRITDSTVREEILQQIEEGKNRKKRQELQLKVATAGATLFFVLIIATSIALYRENQRATDQVHQTAEALNLAKENETKANKALQLARSEQYIAAIGLASSALNEGNTAKALETLLETAPEEERAWEWGALMSLMSNDDRTLLRNQTEKRRSIFHTAISPDGKTLITGHFDGIVTVWDLPTLTKKNEWKYDLRAIWCLDFHPSGERFVASSLDGKADVIELETGRVVYTLSVELPDRRNFMRGVAYNRDGSIIATTSRDGMLTLWNSEDGSKIKEIALASSTYDVAFHPTLPQVAVCTVSGDLPSVFDVNTGEKIFNIDIGDVSSLGVSYSPTGDRLVIAANDGRAMIVNSQTGKEIVTLKSKGDQLRDVDFSHDGKYLASVDNTGRLHVWKGDSYELIYLSAGAKQMEKVLFHPTLPIIFGTAFDEMEFWDLRRLLPQVVENRILPNSEMTFHLRLPSFPGDDGIIWYKFDDFWMENEGRRLFSLGGKEIGAVDSFYSAYSADGGMRIDIDKEDRMATFHNLNNGRSMLIPTESRIYGAYILPDDSEALLSSIDGAIIYMDMNTQEILETIRLMPTSVGLISRIAADPSSRYLAIGWGQGHVGLYDQYDARLVWFKQGVHALGKPVVDIQFSRDGKMMVTGASDETAIVWNVATGDIISHLKGATLNVISVGFSPDGSRVITSSMDDKVRIWDTKSGRELLTIFDAGLQDDLMAATFSKDGSEVYIATRLGVLHRLSTIPWEKGQFPCGDEVEFLQCMDDWKAENRAQSQWMDE